MIGLDIYKKNAILISITLMKLYSFPTHLHHNLRIKLIEVADRMVIGRAGSLWLDLILSDEDAALIEKEFPNKLQRI